MNNILVCVPTKDRAAMLKEVLTYEAKYYKENNISLLVYDSSENNETLQVILEIRNSFELNIIYMKSDPELCLDYKLVELFKNLEKMSYDYYWLINDSISITEPMIKYVKKLIEEDYDIIRLPLSGSDRENDYITNDQNDWFHNCSSGMAHMASTIFSKSLFKAEHDWDQLSEKYIHNNQLDDKHGYFFTVGFYLEQILKINNFSGIYIGNKIKWRRDSHMKGNQIYWYNYVFETWAKSYVETILAIPDYYTEKDEVIRKSDNIAPGRFSSQMLIHYRLLGLYNITIYHKYKSYFPFITEEKQFICWFIAITPIYVLRKLFPSLQSVESQWEEKLITIEKKISSQKILIYGAGLYGGKVIEKLTADGFGDLICGVAVTNCSGNVKNLFGYDVYSIDDYIDRRKELTVIICALPAMAKQMKKELKFRHFKKIKSLF